MIHHPTIAMRNEQRMDFKIPPAIAYEMRDPTKQITKKDIEDAELFIRILQQSGSL